MADYIPHGDLLGDKESGSPKQTLNPPTEEEVLQALLGSPKFGDEAGLQAPGKIDISLLGFGATKRRLHESYSDDDDESSSDEDDVNAERLSGAKTTSESEGALSLRSPAPEQGFKPDCSLDLEPASKKARYRPDLTIDSEIFYEPDPHPYITDLLPKPAIAAQVPDATKSPTADSEAEPSQSDENSNLLSLRFEEIKGQSVQVLHNECTVPWNWSQAISEAIATVCAKTFWNVSSLKERHVETAQHLQELYNRSSQLSQNFENMNADFDKFKSRRSQKELQGRYLQIQGELEKLRYPDVTLENMEKQIQGFKDNIDKQNDSIDKFKDGCAKEMNRIADVRKTFKREVKEQKSQKKDDLSGLDQRLVIAEEALEELIANSKTLDGQFPDGKNLEAILDQKFNERDKIFRTHFKTVHQRLAEIRELYDDFLVEYAGTAEKVGEVEHEHMKMQDKLVRIAQILCE